MSQQLTLLQHDEHLSHLPDQAVVRAVDPQRQVGQGRFLRYFDKHDLANRYPAALGWFTLLIEALITRRRSYSYSEL
jgi:hypothetical protein